MTLPAYAFRDPAKVYEEKEARSCAGCKHEGREKMFGKVIKFCTKRKRHGARCTLYALPEAPTCTESQTEQEPERE